MAPYDTRSPCGADALFSVTPLEVNGRTVGINRLGDIIAEVRQERLSGDRRIREGLLVRVEKTNYIPPALREAYADALLSRYHSSRPDDRKGA